MQWFIKRRNLITRKVDTSENFMWIASPNITKQQICTLSWIIFLHFIFIFFTSPYSLESKSLSHGIGAGNSPRQIHMTCVISYKRKFQFKLVHEEEEKMKTNNSKIQKRQFSALDDMLKPHAKKPFLILDIIIEQWQ